ncbi:hypothetical protein H0H81_002604 [Sphagnurus paluster]|uniref:AB hydrolase-1 domain-containing protein n=1 Tax=Sphagnurus paluster TaxID=117069 RepID=A0A9P7GW01_9AGAR|nr:hypothetical protein H0H81_002604 [Sphagnurus paluster]
MDSSLYKSVATGRQLKYNYYYSVPALGKPVLLFLHGFPNTSNDWRHQVTFFKERGFGLVVPDMLGYGGTDELHGVQAQGSVVVGRLANYYPDRFLGFGFLAVGYNAPSDAKFEQFIAFVRHRTFQLSLMIQHFKFPTFSPLAL